jgi:hypothetical protein
MKACFLQQTKLTIGTNKNSDLAMDFIKIIMQLTQVESIYSILNIGSGS